jgi:heptosyltransferase I
MDFMKIAIVKLSALGDIVHAMIVLQFIKKYNEEILIDWIVEESYQDLLEFHPDINKVQLINVRQAKKKKSLFLLISELINVRKFGPYDIVIDLQGLIKSALITRLIPSKKTIGFDKDSTREGLAALFYSDRFNIGYDKNIIERNIRLIEASLGFSISEKEIQSKDPFLFTEKKLFEIKLSKNKKNILLIPGASSQSKCYPISSFAEFTNLYDANFFVIWGNENEKMMADQLKVLSPSVNICKKLSIGSLISLISSMDLVVGPDTGPTHMAWSLNIPSITLFGLTPGYRNTCETKINKIIESDSVVNPNKIDKNDNSILNIKAIDLADMALKLMS